MAKKGLERWLPSDATPADERAAQLDLIAEEVFSLDDRADAFEVAADAWEEAGRSESAELRRAWSAQAREQAEASRNFLTRARYIAPSRPHGKGQADGAGDGRARKRVGARG